MSRTHEDEGRMPAEPQGLGRQTCGRALELGILAAALISAAYLALSLGTPGEEDAFIYFRYALNWARGQGLAFNPGDPLEGFSSPLWMALVGWTTRLGAVPHVAARALSLACGVAAVAGCWRLTAMLGGSRMARLGAAISVGLNFWFLTWSESGLETAAYSLALTLAVSAAVRALAPGAAPNAALRAGLLLALTTLSRPEGVLVPIVTLWHAWRRGLGTPRLRRLAAPTGAALSACLAWRQATFHAWLPNTSVKFYPLHVDRSLPQALGFVVFLGIAGLLLPAAQRVSGRLRSRPGDEVTWVWLLGVLLSLGLDLLIGGDYREGFRYMMPALPLLAAAAWCSFERLTREWAAPRRRAAAAALLASLLVGSAFDWWRNPWTCWQPSQAVARWRDPYADRTHWGVNAAIWLLQHARPGSLVAYGQMGKAPYLLALRGRDVRFLDTVGWVDREVAEIYRFDRKTSELLRSLLGGQSLTGAIARGRRERAERFVDLVLARNPDLILIEPHLQHSGMNELLPRDPRFIAGYQKVADLGPAPLVAAYARRLTR
jgi:hypothetical protein